MNSEYDLLRIVESGENSHIEFKRLVHSPEKIAKSICAFANTSGGVILIGVDDDKRIVGIESEKETTEIIYEAATQFCLPQIEFSSVVYEFKGRDVLAVLVDPSTDKPHFHLSHTRDLITLKKKLDKKVYIRTSDKNIAASDEMIQLLLAEKKPIKITYGNNERTLFQYLDTYHRITLHEFSRLVNISDRRASGILISLVKAGVIHIHGEGKLNFYTLANIPRY